MTEYDRKWRANLPNKATHSQEKQVSDTNDHDNLREPVDTIKRRIEQVF